LPAISDILLTTLAVEEDEQKEKRRKGTARTVSVKDEVKTSSFVKQFAFSYDGDS
jgi:hypothetical protein